MYQCCLFHFFKNSPETTLCKGTKKIIQGFVTTNLKKGTKKPQKMKIFVNFPKSIFGFSKLDILYVHFQDSQKDFWEFFHL